MTEPQPTAPKATYRIFRKGVTIWLGLTSEEGQTYKRLGWAVDYDPNPTRGDRLWAFFGYVGGWRKR